MAHITYKANFNIRYRGRLIEKGRFLVVPFETIDLKFKVKQGALRRLDVKDSLKADDKKKVKVTHDEEIIHEEKKDIKKKAKESKNKGRK